MVVNEQEMALAELIVSALNLDCLLYTSDAADE